MTNLRKLLYYAGHKILRV